MAAIALLRHGPTRWNAEKRLQGQRDTVLSPDGREVVAAWRLPAPWSHAAIVSSPLRRCLETIEILRETHPDLGSPTVDRRFIERDWGSWEGRTLAEMRREQGERMVRNEALGLDFRPDGGESAREMQHRLVPALAELAQQDEGRLVVAHRGVIRAIYALATGWDMRTDPPDKLSRHALQVFLLARDGAPAIADLNVRLSAYTER